ncbi:hypothetical protein [Marilutibacter chinensis]|uniref:Uncharacterized protein n=1 Tax=Marilutibacter chinensis TaxID=2912247 RepID=A0ABS9HWY3_9GAMM|nr:hypothetical protein [Lysobacter chinensis]MCF7223390.1 hypothetical protein [Lysobacter chinensis]
MFAHAFRFDHARFQDRVRAAVSPHKPRQRWLRFAFGLLGLAILAVLVMFSVVVGAAMIAAGLLLRLWQQRGRPTASHRVHGRGGRVVDGEFRVVDTPRLHDRPPPPVR